MTSYNSALLEEVRRIQAKTREARAREARASFEAQVASRKRQQEIFTSALTAEQRAGLKADVPAFVSELFKSREADAKKLDQTIHKTSAPWEFDWREVNPGDADMIWYGPDKGTGQIGGRLRSQAAGDCQAITSVGMSYYASRTINITVRAYFHINHTYLDAGGVAPSSGEAKVELGISAFENDQKFGITMEEYQRVHSWGPVPPFPHFSSTGSDNQDADRALHLNVAAGHLYTFYFECLQTVGTWGPAGAQCDANVVVSYSLVAEP